MKVEQNPIAQSLLEQIRQHQQQISETRIEAGFEVDADNNQVNFSELVGSALDEVNALKKSSAASAAAYGGQQAAANLNAKKSAKLKSRDSASTEESTVYMW